MQSHQPHRRLRSHFPAVVLGVAATALAGCAGHGTRSTTVIQPPALFGLPRPPAIRLQNPPGIVPPSVGSLVRVEREPPAPQAELTPTSQPTPDSVWLPGYWAWQNNQYAWVSGRWEKPPRAGAEWVPPRWDRTDNGYVFTEGYWR